MSEVGTQLKTEREARGLTRADVSRNTGIFIHYLSALEHGNFEELPDDATVAGFVRAYALYLGFEPDEPVAEFCTERGIEVPDFTGVPETFEGALPDDEAAEEEGATAPEQDGAAAEEVAPADDAAPAEPVPAEEAGSRRNEPPEGVASAGTIAPADAETVPATEASAGTPRRMPWPWLAAAAAVVVLLAWWGMRDEPAREPAVSDPGAAAVAGPDSPESEETPTEEPGPAISGPAETGVAETERDSPRTETAPARPGPSAEQPSATQATPRGSEPVAGTPPPTLSVSEYGVGTGVVDHRLVGESDRFPPGTRVWFWTRVRGGSRGDRVLHVWIHEGREVFRLRLRVGSANWRTQSAKTLYEGSTGRWAVEARDEAGNVVARSEFTCER